MKRFKVCLIPALMCIALPTATAQNLKDQAPLMTYEEALSGISFPLSLRASDLNGDFRRVRVVSVDSLRGMGAGAYYTKGQSVTVAGTTFLLAYRREFNFDLNAMGHGQAPMPTKLRTKEKLLISLIDAKSIYGGSISDVRPFDRELDMESEADRNALVVTTMQQLGQGIMQWKHNRGQEKLPKWGDKVTPQLRQTCYPFVHDKRLWEHPSTEEAFRLNPELSEKRLPDIANRNLLYMVYEAKPSADGTRAVLFADGHVERVEAERWPRIIKVKAQLRKTPSAMPVPPRRMTPRP